MTYHPERRQRYIKNLIQEAIINVLKEQEPIVPTSAVPPASPGIAPETNGVESMTPDVAPQEQDFTTELMVDKLNVLRGGKSFTDPEVFGRLTEFFNVLTDEQKGSLENMLTELGKAVIGATEEEAGLEDPEQQQTSAPAQPPQASIPPPASGAPAAGAPVAPSF